MYIWLFSRSVGAASARTWKTRGLTRSVIALIVPPFPAPSRPSKTMQILIFLAFTHSWSFTSSTWSFSISLAYSFPDNFSFPSTLEPFARFLSPMGHCLGDLIEDVLTDERGVFVPRLLPMPVDLPTWPCRAVTATLAPLQDRRVR